jgi:hypothetical protein
MKWNWRLAARLAGLVTLFWIIDWSTYLIDWLWPPNFHWITIGVEY